MELHTQLHVFNLEVTICVLHLDLKGEILGAYCEELGEPAVLFM